jgi:hypothetical protein
MVRANHMPIEIKLHQKEAGGYQVSYNVDLHGRTLHHNIAAVKKTKQSNDSSLEKEFDFNFSKAYSGETSSGHYIK